MKRGRKVGHCFTEYALYKGDEFLDIGTADALSEKWNISKKTIHWLACCKRYHNQNHKGGYVVLKLGLKEDIV